MKKVTPSQQLRDKAKLLKKQQSYMGFINQRVNKGHGGKRAMRQSVRG